MSSSSASASSSSYYTSSSPSASPTPHRGSGSDSGNGGSDSGRSGGTTGSGASSSSSSYNSSTATLTESFSSFKESMSSESLSHSNENSNHRHHKVFQESSSASLDVCVRNSEPLVFNDSSVSNEERTPPLDQDGKLSVVPPRVLLKNYKKYLKVVIIRGSVSAEQYNIINQLRSRYEIADIDHQKALHELGWTVDRFEAARFAIPEEYRTYLQAIMVDNIIDPSEMEALEEIRSRYGIDAETHTKALKELGYTESDFLLACARGTCSETISRFGSSSTSIKTEEVETTRYCRGLFVLPHLHQWWGKNSNGKRILVREPGADHRTATAQELFYDLVFVAVIASLVHLLAVDPPSYFNFFVMFSCVFRIWNSQLFYATAFDQQDMAHRIFSFIQMYGVILMGTVSAETFAQPDVSGAYWTSGFILGMSPIIVQYFYLSIWGSKGKLAARFRGLQELLPTLVLVVALIVNKHYIIFWSITLFLFEVTRLLPIVFIRFSFLRPFHQPLAIEHVVERYGLMMIIVLGETVSLSVIAGRFTAEVYVAIACGLMIAFCMKWIYFDVDEEKEKHPYRRGVYHGLLWNYVHWPLFVAIASQAAGIYGVLDDISNYSPQPSDGQLDDSHKRSLQDYFASSPSPDAYTNTTNSTTPISGHGEEDHLADYHQYLMCFSMSAAIFFMGIQSLVSRHGSHTIFSKTVRLIVRGSVAVLLIAIPFIPTIRGGLLQICLTASLMLCLVTFELVSNLPKSGASDDLFDESSDPNDVRNFINRAYSRRLLLTSTNLPLIATEKSPLFATAGDVRVDV